METINVFLGINGIQNLVGIDLLGQGELDQYAVELRVLVQLLNLGEKLLLGGVLGENYCLRVDTQLLAGLALGRDIGYRGRVLANAHNDQTGGHPFLLFDLLYLLFQLLANLCCYLSP